MQRLEVSGAVRPIYGSLGVKRLIRIPPSQRLPKYQVRRTRHAVIFTKFCISPTNVYTPNYNSNTRSYCQVFIIFQKRNRKKNLNFEISGQRTSRVNLHLSNAI